MLYKIKSLLFANQILPDANFKMDGLAPTAVFFFLSHFPSFQVSSWVGKKQNWNNAFGSIWKEPLL